MYYIDEAFERMNLQQLISFFLFGTDDFTEKTRPYKDTLKKSCDPIYRRLDAVYPDGEARDAAAADLSLALSAYERVYMEVGMKAGARLLHQLLVENDPTLTKQEGGA